MSDADSAKHPLKLVDNLIEKCSKEDIVDAARLLALNVAHYQSKYGALSLEETLAMLCEDCPQQRQLSVDGAQILANVLESFVTEIRVSRH
ncbi:MAG: hypothetical protein Q8O24_05405 [Gallionellaceae bacterium]|nr:hypothetical protein [Gallionellaceae bacterium]